MTFRRRPYSARFERVTSELEAVEQSGFGTVAGVHIDLRHPLLDHKMWSVIPIKIMMLSNDGALLLREDIKKPNMWFPWFGNFEIHNFRDLATDIYWSEEYYLEYGPEGNKSKEKSQLDFERLIHNVTPTYFINKEDCIVVNEVKNVAITDSDEFEYEHDNIKKHVFLKIIKSDKSEEIVTTPYKIKGELSILHVDSASHNIFEIVLRRICRHYTLSEFESMGAIADRTSKTGRAASIGYKLFRTFKDLLEHQYDDFDGRNNDLRVISDAVLLGFLWANAEADLNIKPLAKAAAEARQKSKEWGEKSGDRRRQAAKQGWMRIAADMAKELRAKNPTLSQEALAERIREICKDRKLDMKGGPMIKKTHWIYGGGQ